MNNREGAKARSFCFKMKTKAIKAYINNCIVYFFDCIHKAAFANERFNIQKHTLPLSC